MALFGKTPEDFFVTKKKTDDLMQLPDSIDLDFTPPPPRKPKYGYHRRKIEKGVLGEVSKIVEEDTTLR